MLTARLASRPAYVAARRVIRPLLLLASLCLALPSIAANGDALPPGIRTALDRAGIPAEDFAAVVVTADGSTILSHNPDRPMNPASVMKLVTTFAALDVLGPAHVWRTEVRATGPVVDGHLRGDLVLKGDGDPGLTLEALWMLLRDIRARGIEHIDGDLLLDRSAFAVADEDPALFDGEPTRPYNAGPDALLLNHRSVRLTFAPDPLTRTVRILVDPPLPDVRIVDQLEPGDGPCDGWPEKPEVDLPGRSLTFRGTYPLACGDKVRHFMLLPPVEYAQSLLAQLWGSLGGTFGGSIREASTPAGTWLVTRAESRPLADLVRDIDKHSNNVMARQVFLTLGRGPDGTPATVESARAAIVRWADARGLAAPELVVDNGAGLSRIERISAGALVRLLRAAHESPLGAEFVASLPLAGVDGTLKRWFLGTPVAGRAHLKTGYLDGVRAIAGYVHGDGGRTAFVVGIVNHRNARAAAAVQEALVGWAFDAATSSPMAPDAARGCGRRRPAGCTGMRRAAPMAPSPPSTTAR